MRSKKSKRKTNRKRKKTNRKRKTNKKLRKFKYELHYFKIPKCKWCIEFQNTILKRLHKIKNLKIKTFLGRENPDLIHKYNIKLYPALVRVTCKKYKIYKDERKLNTILKFLK